jgi:hypothetical protein
MSHGRIQLQVLEFLLRDEEHARARGDKPRFVALIEIAGDGATRARIEAVLRAAQTLAEQGLITLRRDDRTPLPLADQLSVSARRASELTARLGDYPK